MNYVLLLPPLLVLADPSSGLPDTGGCNVVLREMVFALRRKRPALTEATLLSERSTRQAVKLIALVDWLRTDQVILPDPAIAPIVFLRAIPRSK